MDEFFTPDPSTIGSKGLVYIGDDILVYRRDDKTESYPFCIDLPGGAPIDGETPFDTFQREVKEEFGLELTPGDITYIRRYPSRINPTKAAYFPVAKLEEAFKDEIRLGDEGIDYFLLSVEDYLNKKDVAWPLLQERVSDYIRTLSQ